MKGNNALPSFDDPNFENAMGEFATLFNDKDKIQEMMKSMMQSMADPKFQKELQKITTNLTKAMQKGSGNSESEV